MPSNVPGESRRSRFASNRLWLVAAALGIGTTHLTMLIVHDTSRRREAVHLVAQTVANQLATSVATRAELVTMRSAIPPSSHIAMLRDSVFIPSVREATLANAQIARLDSLSVRMTNGDSSITLGALSERNQFRASSRISGVLKDWSVTVALRNSQLPAAFVAPVPDERLWLVGLLGLLTIAVLIVAVRSSQREVVLARARSDFIAGVSHELRMPLAQILLAGETIALKRERSDDERAGLARSIVREARRLVGLVDNVLFFSRTESPKQRARMESVDARSLFDNVVESVDLAVADAGQTIEASADTGLSLRADNDLMRQALVNLVDNAIKYGKRGQRIRLTATRTSGGRIRIHVDDDGPGIPAADRERVFDAYERLDRDQVSERTGTGLGLAIVRRIADACGGSVWIDASPTGGARVTLELGAT